MCSKLRSGVAAGVRVGQVAFVGNVSAAAVVTAVVVMETVGTAATAVVALYMAGQHDPKVLASAFVAGLVGPIMKALDKSAPEFGLKK